MIAILVVLSIVAAVSGATAQAPAPFGEFKTFRCEFFEGEGRAVVNGKTTDRRGDKFSDPVILDNIDYQKRSARLVGGISTGADVSLLRDGPLAVTFAEYTPQGGIVTLTLYKHAAGFNVYHRAVMSRHIATFAPEGTLIMTQHYGTCRGLL